MISREANLPRKAMRVAIPLFVEIDGKLHAASDWSTTGLGVADLPRQPAEGEVVDARLSFPMLESTLLIPVRMAYRGEHDGVSGFEFEDLSPRNRRILRHYIELSLDGKLGDVEDIVAAAALPATQVEAPLMLQGRMPGSAAAPRPRTWPALLGGVAVLAVAGAIAFYNYAYRLQGTGFVSGSIARVTANLPGRVQRVLVQPGARVQPGMPLFAVEDQTLHDEITALEQQLAQVDSRQSQLAVQARSAQSGLLQALKRDWAARERELADARQLLQNGAITQRDVLLVANQVQDLRQNYLRQVAEGAARIQGLDSGDALNRMRLELAAKKAQLAREEADRVVRSPVRGKVFSVDREAGEFVAARDPVVLLEADVTPSVLLRLANDDALKLRIGLPATIYVPSEDKKYSARVSAVGLAAVDAAAPVTQEGGANETLVKIDFDDPRVRLPANLRVNVWIRNPAFAWS